MIRRACSFLAAFMFFSSALLADEPIPQVPPQAIVIPANRRPNVNLGIDQIVTTSSLISLNATVSDDGRPVGSVLTYQWSVVSAAGYVSLLNPTSLEAKVSFGSPGIYVLRLSVSDGRLTGTDDIQFTAQAPVPVPNRPPVFNPIAPITADEESLITFTATATDPDNNALTYSLNPGAPKGTALDPQTGVFTWEPTEAQGPGVYTITITAKDNGSPSLQATVSVIITVNEVDWGLSKKLILLVDNTMTTPLAAELARLERDLVGDNWVVYRHNVARDASVQQVKELIIQDYATDPVNFRAVFLFGHIPVPLSGFEYPDGHWDRARPAGADMYYGDMDGVWKDENGDGVFDHTLLPSLCEMGVGRVDFWNLPELALSETELLRQYLNKNHNYRHKIDVLPETSLYEDRNGIALARPEMQALVGSENVFDASYPTLKTQESRWAYGAALATSLGITPNDFNGTDLKTNFHWIYGSYSWDWRANTTTPGASDIQLRHLIAGNKYGLSSIWGLPGVWETVPLLRGQPMGEMFRQSVNKLRRPWMALMGDPTLRIHPVLPPTDPRVTRATNGDLLLTWNISSDQNILGYDVFWSLTPEGPFTPLNLEPVTASGYRHVNPPNGSVTYRVCAVQNKTTTLGSYENPSQGVFITYINPAAYPEPNNPVQRVIRVKNVANPLRGELAEIGVDVLSRQRVTVLIYDRTGREIRRLTDKEVDAGFHIEPWDGRDESGTTVASGLYFALIRNGDQVQRMKIVIAK